MGNGPCMICRCCNNIPPSSNSGGSSVYGSNTGSGLRLRSSSGVEGSVGEGTSGNAMLANANAKISSTHAPTANEKGPLQKKNTHLSSPAL